jgi:glycosyltransferase involved in cell wall biosynthesis
MNHQPLISIIIPVYNGSEYIENSYLQLSKQTYTDFECIYVNDGSTDQSLEILNEIEKKDNRIRVFTQENKGQGVARNLGIDAARGIYITFMDIDDKLSSNMFEIFSVKYKFNAEIYSFEYAQEINGKISYLTSSFNKEHLLDNHYIQNEILVDLLTTESFSAVWSKFYKNEFIKHNSIRFPNLKFYEEDLNFNLKAYNLCNSAYIIDHIGYYYSYNQYGFSKNVLSTNFFKIAYEKYSYDYKNELQLKLEQKIIDECNSIRYIHKMVWLFFVYAREKKLNYKNSYDIILKHILDESFVTLVKQYINHPKIRKGMIQYFVIKNICYKNEWILKSLIFLFKTFYFESFVLKIKKYL